MKTKNILVLAALIFSSILNVKGLFAQTTTDDVTLNIVLKPIQSIVVNPATDHKTVDLVYSTMDNYKNGATEVVKVKHLTVFSTGGFQVKVNSGEFLTNGTTNIDASDVTVLATNASGNNVANTATTAVSLGLTEGTLITSTEGGRSLEYDVTYNNELGKNDAYINLYEKDGVNTFTTTVTYTIAAM